MARIIAITDLHLTAGGARIIGLDPAKRFTQVFDHALAHYADADLMVLMGDLTHDGDREAYLDLRRILSRAPMPVLAIPGNHDRRDVFLDVFPDSPRSPGGFVRHSLDLNGTQVILLDTLDAPPHMEGHHAGRLCPVRFDWLDTVLKPGPAVIFAHHPPGLTGLPGMDAIRLAEGDALLDRLKRHGDAHLICGHIHRAISASTRGVPWTVLKSPCHQAPLDFDTPDSALSVDEPPGYGLVLAGPAGIAVHHVDVFPDAPNLDRDPGSA